MSDVFLNHLSLGVCYRESHLQRQDHIHRFIERLGLGNIKYHLIPPHFTPPAMSRDATHQIRLPGLLHPSNNHDSSAKWTLQLLKLFYHICGLHLFSLCYQ